MPSQFNYNREGFQTWLENEWSTIYPMWPTINPWDGYIGAWNATTPTIQALAASWQIRQFTDGIDDPAMRSAVTDALGTVYEIISEQQLDDVADAIEENSEAADA